MGVVKVKTPLDSDGQPLIVNVKRARRLLGRVAIAMSDEELKAQILKLDDLATEYLRAVSARQ